MAEVNRYALVRNGTVQNLCLWDGDTSIWQPPVNMTAVPLTDSDVVSIGDSYSAETGFSPASVSE